MPTSRFPPAKDQQVIVVCDSAEITAGDISEVLTALKSLSSDRSSAMSAEGAVTLVFPTATTTIPVSLSPFPK